MVSIEKPGVTQDLYAIFEEKLTPDQLQVFHSLDTPGRIQAFLDQTLYSASNANRSPLQVMQDRVAHCLDGALFAAAALHRCGYPPLLVDLFPDPDTDDDHVLAIFKKHGCWGAVAKSNYAGLRYREPIHRSLRELALSYFEDFYNLYAKKTLRTYTRPFNLVTVDHLNWLWDATAVDTIMDRMYHHLKRIPLLTPEMVAGLQPVDKLAYDSGMLATNMDGVYKPQPSTN